MPHAKAVLALLAILLLSGSAAAQHGSREQDIALARVRNGQIRPLHEIEQRVVPRMGGAEYLGPELDKDTGIYRLKFMRAGAVIWVDVDGRTGQVLGRSGD